jgi:hypothetical protein
MHIRGRLCHTSFERTPCGGVAEDAFSGFLDSRLVPFDKLRVPRGRSESQIKK